MNERQLQLFQNLKNLVATTEVFLTKIHELDGKFYQVFDYRLASYSDFLLPDAREARGIMFEVDSNGNPIRLACWMPMKFFNICENPLTMNLDLSDDNIDGVMDKLDGSIISTLMHGDKMILKSKTSLSSDHVVEATKWFKGRPYLKDALTTVTKMGYSVHMELTSPDLRIVVGYPTTNLHILSMRHTEDGTMISKRDLPKLFNEDLTFELQRAWVSDFTPKELLKVYTVFDKTVFDSVASFIDNVKSMTGVEGFVVRLKNGEHVKVKCDWYCTLHRCKSDVQSPRKLYEAIIMGCVDDMLALFSDDVNTFNFIIQVQKHVNACYNRVENEVETFYHNNKHLDRKSYAIKGQQCLQHTFGLAMMLYLGKSVSYKDFMIKNYDNYKFPVLTPEVVVEE